MTDSIGLPAFCVELAVLAAHITSVAALIVTRKQVK